MNDLEAAVGPDPKYSERVRAVMRQRFVVLECFCLGLYCSFLVTMAKPGPKGYAQEVFKRHQVLVGLSGLLTFFFIFSTGAILRVYLYATEDPRTRLLARVLESLVCISGLASPLLLIAAMSVPAKHMWAPLFIKCYLSVFELLINIFWGAPAALE